MFDVRLAGPIILASTLACATGVALPDRPPDPTAGIAARSQLWLDDHECALSCHTTHPFVLASKHLGPKAEPVRDRILERVEARVQNWASAQPWYSMSAEKAAQSRGTEAILNAVALTTHDSPAAETAIRNLFAEQRPDGGWHWLDFDLAPWESADAEIAGAALAAVAIGSSESGAHARVETLREYLGARSSEALNLHNQLMLLWASRHLDGFLDEEVRERMATAVGSAQRPDGSWSSTDLGEWRRTDGQPNRASDGDAYATGLAAFVLAQLADSSSRAAAAEGRRWLRANQGRSGRWRGRSLNDGDRFNRMLAGDAATAFAVLALAQK